MATNELVPCRPKREREPIAGFGADEIAATELPTISRLSDTILLVRLSVWVTPYQLCALLVAGLETSLRCAAAWFRLPSPLGALGPPRRDSLRSVFELSKEPEQIATQPAPVMAREPDRARPIERLGDESSNTLPKSCTPPTRAARASRPQALERHDDRKRRPAAPQAARLRDLESVRRNSALAGDCPSPS